jgi:hypothetical protein
MLSQISFPRTLSAETWAAIVAALGSALLIAKKLISRHRSQKPEYITRAEFHQGIEATRNRIGGSYLALSEKIDANHKELLAAITAQGTAFETRIDQLETSFARVDERTKR